MKGFHYTVNDSSPGFNYNRGNVSPDFNYNRDNRPNGFNYNRGDASPGFHYNRSDVSPGFNYNRYDGKIGFKYNKTLTPEIFSTKIFYMKTNDNKPYLTSYISEQVFDMFLANQEPVEPTEKQSFDIQNIPNNQWQQKTIKAWTKSKNSKQNNKNKKGNGN